MINRFILNEVSYFGPGAREVLPQEISRLGLQKAFVTTDKELIKFGVAKYLKKPISLLLYSVKSNQILQYQMSRQG